MAWRRNQLKMAKWRHINIINGTWLMALASAKLSAGLAKMKPAKM
jgi:hypothetical protein